MDKKTEVKFQGISGIILGMGSANERRCYNITLSLIGWAHSQNGNWIWKQIPKLLNWKHLFQQGKSEGFDSCDRSSNLTQLDSNHQFFSQCDLEIWRMTPKNNRAPLLCYFKLFVSFCSHWWIQTGVTVWKRLIWVKIDANTQFGSNSTIFRAVWPWNLTDDLAKW